MIKDQIKIIGEQDVAYKKKIAELESQAKLLKEPDAAYKKAMADLEAEAKRVKEIVDKANAGLTSLSEHHSNLRKILEGPTTFNAFIKQSKKDPRVLALMTQQTDALSDTIKAATGSSPVLDSYFKLMDSMTTGVTLDAINKSNLGAAKSEKPKRFECWLKDDAAEVLDKQGGNKSDFVNRAIVAYWHMSEGDKMPLLDPQTIKVLANEIARQIKRSES